MIYLGLQLNIGRT